MSIQKRALLCIVIGSTILLCSCANKGNLGGIRKEIKESFSKAKNIADEVSTYEKGYNLPLDDKQRDEATTDCKKILEFTYDIYKQADKGEAVNIVLSEDVILKMQNKIKKLGCPVIATVTYSNMKNFKKMDAFLKKCEAGQKGTEIVYEIQSDGGIGRTEYIFDGTDMCALAASATWNENNQPLVNYVTYTRIKKWNYTKRGWFECELCVPEPPEVNEIVNGSILTRVLPLTKKQQEMSKKYVLGLGYQGNNLLCSNWDANHIKKLDYNGMYEYLYAMKYQKKFPTENYSNGIPKKEFERLIMEYLPVTAKQIQAYAVFDKKRQTYEWARLGCMNYSPTEFGSSLPEVTDIKENEDGTITLIVVAVCDVSMCDDAVITHELTVKFAEDGSFQYFGNKILDNGIERIPPYQYRLR